MDNDQELFKEECVPIDRDWTPTCSLILQRNANSEWLQTDVDKIFEEEIGDERISDPLPRKISSLTADCINSPIACQTALLRNCSKTYLPANIQYKGGAGILCGCFAPTSSLFQSCECRESVKNFNIPPCFGTFCRVNNIRLLLYNSSIGDLNILQQCGSNDFFSESYCSINDVTLVANGSSISSLSLTQKCFGREASGTNEENLLRTEGERFFEEEEQSIPSSLWYILLLFIFFLFFFFYLLSLFLYRRESLNKIIEEGRRDFESSFILP